MRILSISKTDLNKNNIEKMNMIESFSSEHKVAIRKNWNLPLIKFLSKREEKKLIYMGLPSPQAEDIKEWIEYLESIVAFQCRNHKESSSPEQSREQVEILEEFLRTLERQNKINNYVVYDGFLEEVIIRGFDNSPQQIEFIVNNFIPLYNLDFCNKISSPIEFTDREGNLKTAYKFDAIKELLSFQRKWSKTSNKFIFLLTVHGSFDGKELEHFLNNPKTSENAELLKKYYQLSGIEKNERIIKLFVVQYIKEQFESFGFTPNILPVIRYNGLGGTPLLHFAILGSMHDTKAGITEVYQSISDIINCKFVNIDENGNFTNATFCLDNEMDIVPDPISYLTQSKTFEKLWK
ncbi:hypothetical protein [Corallibacter sp.]|uniref:hypothetical protein n=1 Tax=Corallibacter sp. TaxID=2038084 RepID=UPI003AB1E8B4